MKDKMTIILFSGELDKAIAAFTLATTAAATAKSNQVARRRSRRRGR